MFFGFPNPLDPFFPAPNRCCCPLASSQKGLEKGSCPPPSNKPGVAHRNPTGWVIPGVVSTRFLQLGVRRFKFPFGCWSNLSHQTHRRCVLGSVYQGHPGRTTRFPRPQEPQRSESYVDHSHSMPLGREGFWAFGPHPPPPTGRGPRTFHGHGGPRRAGRQPPN